jgi:hypothetical protein
LYQIATLRNEQNASKQNDTEVEVLDAMKLANAAPVPSCHKPLCHPLSHLVTTGTSHCTPLNLMPVKGSDFSKPYSDLPHTIEKYPKPCTDPTRTENPRSKTRLEKIPSSAGHHETVRP